MASSHEQNYNATVEDYDSDQSDGHVLRENFPRKSSTPSAQANVSTKRSKDLNQEKTPAQEKMAAYADVRSDSGYSSYTGISKSSADSAPSATSRSPPVLPTTTAPMPSQSPAPKPRRPTGGEQRQHSNESSPRQKPSRTVSVSTKHRPAGQRRPTLTQKPEECRDPTCTKCGPNALPQPLPQRRRPDMQPSQSTRDISQYPSDQRSVWSGSSDPSPYSPPSPIYYRQPGPYMKGPAVIETGQTRRRSSSTIRQRPQSFAGDPSGNWVPGMPITGYPSPPHERLNERGPPLSNSAYQNMPFNIQYAPIPAFIPPPQQGGYYPVGLQGPGPFDSQRPPLSARGSSSQGPRSYPAPIITQESSEPSKYSARYGQPPTPIEPKMKYARKPKLLQYQQEVEASETESSEDEEEEEEEEEGVQYEYDAREDHRSREARTRALMPPPALKRNPSQRRPPLAHANTTQNVYPPESRRSMRRNSAVIVTERTAPRERERERERDRAPRPSAAPSRHGSISRPPIHRQSQSEYDTRSTRVVVNNSRNNRPQSYQAMEKAYEEYAKAKALEDQYNAERKREKRASRITVQDQRRPIPGQFDDDEEEEEEEEEEPTRPALRSRRKTDASDVRKGKERPVEVKNKRAENAAEEYIMSTRGSHEAYADQINKAAKKASRMPSLPSDSGSSHSNGSGNRTTMTSNTNNEIRLRLANGSAPVSLQFSGDMDGRTLQLVPAENGATDLVIGNARGGETSYRNERGSVMSSNRRSIVAGQGRRDAEDVSERSSRSGRNRRDRDEIRESRDDRDARGHVLRRSRTANYH